MAGLFGELGGRPAPDWYAAADPPDGQLGSGAATAHLLAGAWRATGQGRTFDAWLGGVPKLIVHGGGQSRRLPAYAAVGKPLMPVPVLRWSRGQRLDQSLLDLQLPAYERVLGWSGGRHVALVTSGDVVLRFGRDLPPVPAVDVLGLGMWVTPERARDFGAFFVARAEPTELAFFLQKPSPARTRELSAEYLCLVDTGMWLLSARAVAVLLRKAGWDAERQAFADGRPAGYDLYGQFGPALGRRPSQPDPEIGALTSGVVPLPEAEFYHFGTNRQLLESTSALQNRVLDELKLGLAGARRHPDQYLQNTRFSFPLRQEENHTLWVENSVVPGSWRLAHTHVLTGVPDNAWDLKLEPGVCLDFVPVGERAFCLRPYGIDDPFRGRLGDAGTPWLGRPAPNWFFARSIDPEAIGMPPQTDIHAAPLFPVLAPEELDPRFIEWLFTAHPEANPAFVRRWTAAERLSAAAIPARVNLRRLLADRARNRDACLLPLLQNHRWSVFYRLDLESTSRLFAATDHPLPPWDEPPGAAPEPMQTLRRHMVHAAVLRQRGQPDWERHEAEAFRQLRQIIEREAEVSTVLPGCDVQEDQIVWGRSPARLDLAGGWTDTPPYCLEHGGQVLNVAVDLNGQPPQQVFVRLGEEPVIVVRSIDLGVEQRIATYEELDTFAQPGSGFALAKAALALAGFLPRFHARGGHPTLRQQLEDFGGGIEISMVAAVPKGSGLGTSSIMAATLLAALGDFCGLGWDRNVLFQRTLAVEQMVTTGGGWQDQAGGIFRGIKLIATETGLAQRPT
jgi:hypothetical protein